MIVFLFSPSSFAVKSAFLQQGITEVASENIPTQPAVLGFIEKRWRLSASGNSLNQTTYDKTESDSSKKSPLSIDSIYVATAKGTSHGGFGFSIKSIALEVESNSLQVGSGFESTSTSNIRVNGILASAGFGSRFNESLSWGAAASVVSINIESSFSAILSSQNSKSVYLFNSNQSDIAISSSFGLLFRGPKGNFSFSGSSPMSLLKTSGSQKTTQLDSLTDNLTTTESEKVTPQSAFAAISTGAQVFISDSIDLYFSNSYSFSGLHTPALAVEFKDSETTYLASSTNNESANSIESSYALGRISNSDNVSWGIGPSYRSVRSRATDTSSSATWALVYTSEISF